MITNDQRLDRINDLKKAILEAESMKVWNTWEELNDELEELEEEVTNDTKLKIAQEKWDSLSPKEKMKYKNRPKSIDDIEIINS